MASVRKRRWESRGEFKSAWVVDYTDNGGSRRQATFQLKRHADRFLANLLRELADGTHVPASETTTVKEACELRLKRATREGLEQTTYEEYEQVARSHIIPIIGNLRLTELTKARVEAFRDHLLETRSYHRAKRTISHLKMILAEAKRLGRVANNVATDVKFSRGARHDEEVTILTNEEINDFLDAAEDLGLKEGCFAHLLLHGLRVSEMRGMPWDCFDPDEGTISVKQRANKYCKLGPPKSKKSRRTIQLMPDTVSYLKLWRKEVPDEELVFPRKNGKPMFYARVVKEIFDPIMFKAGLIVTREDGTLFHRYSLHPFRHTTASLWIEQGFSPKRVSAWLGHSSIQITFDLYGHLFDLKFSAEDMMQQLQSSFRHRRLRASELEAEQDLPGLFDFMEAA